MRSYTGLARVLLLLTTLALVGCAGLWHRVDRSLLDGVPNEEKLLLFDAENGVYIAKDEMETADRLLGDTERALERAYKYRDIIIERRSSGNVVDTKQVLDLLSDWNDARIEMRKAEVQYMRQKHRAAESRLWASRARYERAKALLVKDFNPEDGTSIEVEDFDGQVADKEEREQEELAELTEKEKAVSEKRAVYNKLSSRLQLASNGAYGGPWADLLD
jgi:hypothetical protein